MNEVRMRNVRTRPREIGSAPAFSGGSPQKIRWGAVFAGTVLGLALLALLSTLWFALGYGSEVDVVRANLEWYVGLSAIGCLFVGGLLAGWLSGVKGAAAGWFNGMAIWAMVLIITLAVGVPAMMRVFNVDALGRAATGTSAPLGGAGTELWATFWVMLGSLVACALGGALGGAVTRPANSDRAWAKHPATIDREGDDQADIVNVTDRPIAVRQQRIS